MFYPTSIFYCTACWLVYNKWVPWWLYYLQFASDAEHQAQLIVCSRLIGEAVAELLPVCVKESNHELVIGYVNVWTLNHSVYYEVIDY